jgi:hypothetical protein
MPQGVRTFGVAIKGSPELLLETQALTFVHSRPRYLRGSPPWRDYPWTSLQDGQTPSGELPFILFDLRGQWSAGAVADHYC